MIKHLVSLAIGILCAALVSWLCRGTYAKPYYTNIDPETGKGDRHFRFAKVPASSPNLAKKIKSKNYPLNLHAALETQPDPEVEAAWQRVQLYRLSKTIESVWANVVEGVDKKGELEEALDLVNLSDFALAASSKVPPINIGARWYDVPDDIADGAWKVVALATIQAVRKDNRELAAERLGWMWSFHSLQSIAHARSDFGPYSTNSSLFSQYACFLGLIQATQEHKWFLELLKDPGYIDAEDACRKASAATWLDQQIAFGQELNGYSYSDAAVIAIYDLILHPDMLKQSGLINRDQDRIKNLEFIIERDKAVPKLVQATAQALLSLNPTDQQFRVETMATPSFLDVSVSVTEEGISWKLPLSAMQGYIDVTPRSALFAVL